MLHDLAELDPARELRAPGRADDPALERILASDRHAPASVAPPRRPTRPAAVAGAAAAAVVAVAVGQAVVSSLNGPPAYASWTAEPQVLTAEQAADRAAGCPTTASSITEGTGAAEPTVEEVPLDVVSAEARGDYTYVVLAGEHAYADCFVTAAHDGAGDDVVSSSAVVGSPVTGRAAAPGPREVRVLDGGTASWSQGSTGEGAVTSAFGRAGEEVVGIAVTLESGQRVDAAVSDGWWSVWSPGEVALDGPAELTFADGTTAPVDLAGLAP